MVDDADTYEGGAPDRPCATCGHDGSQHLVREAELPGATARETYCEGCGTTCEFVPDPEDPAAR